MVLLSKVAADLNLACPVAAKLETHNPGGSVKDRPALAMIEAAEKDGQLTPGATIIEPTSGNTGVGLAVVAAQRGYKCVFVLTSKVAPEKVAQLTAYGAEVVVCPVAVAPEDPRSYYSTAKRLLEETPNAFGPSQYHNPINPQAHYQSTGPEIWEQTQGRITHFVAGAGTGGTISGAGRYLKEQNPQVQVVVADPDASVYSGGDGRPYLVEGIGEDFWPTTYDTSVVDRVLPVTDAQSFEMARRVTRREGLLIGGSGGTAVYGALQVASELTENDLVVTLIPDSGRGYLSNVFDDGWMGSMGFDIAAAGSGSGSGSEPSASPPDTTFIYVNPSNTAAEAIEAMRANNLEAIPVAKGEMPVAAAEIIGSVSLGGLAELVKLDENAAGQQISEVLEPKLPQVGIGEPPERAAQLLDTQPVVSAVVLFSQGRPVATLNREAAAARASGTGTASTGTG